MIDVHIHGPRFSSKRMKYLVCSFCGTNILGHQKRAGQWILHTLFSEMGIFLKKKLSMDFTRLIFFKLIFDNFILVIPPDQPINNFVMGALRTFVLKVAISDFSSNVKSYLNMF